MRMSNMTQSTFLKANNVPSTNVFLDNIQYFRMVNNNTTK